MILLTASRRTVHVPSCPPEQTKKQRQVDRPSAACSHTGFFKPTNSFWKATAHFGRANMHMDIIPMHISHIIIAVLRRFMLLSSSLYFAEAGRSIPLLAANVNPFFLFLHFF